MNYNASKIWSWHPSAELLAIIFFSPCQLGKVFPDDCTAANVIEQLWEG